MAYSKPKGDVQYFYPNSKINTRPIAYSTIATNDLIVALSYTYNTIEDVYYAINSDDEARAILKKFIDKGYGKYIAKEHFK